MKKLTVILALFTLVAVGAFAQINYSAGGGVSFNGNFGNGVTGKGFSSNVFEEFDIITYGFYGFFDATYVEASIAAGFGQYNWWSWSSDHIGDDKENNTITTIDITLLGKYPFKLGGAITVFPLIGFGYTMFFSMEGSKYDLEPSDYNQFGFLLGGGLDFDLTQTLFLRVTALFQIRFANKYMDDIESELKDIFSTDTSWGMGPVFKLGIGYKL